MKSYWLCLSLLILKAYSLRAQTTISEAEELFRKNNIQLLAAHYDIDAAEAGVIQAKIWELPYLSGEFNAVNPQDNQLFDLGRAGQKGIAVQQLIYLGGKKKSEIALAKSNVALAELQFEQLLVTLRYRLRQQFYELYFNRLKMESVENQARQVDTLIAAYAQQVEKRNLPLKDLVRLQSLALNLRQELGALKQETIALSNELSLLTGSNQPIIPSVELSQLQDRYAKKIDIKLDNLLQLAQQNSPEYRSYLQLAENQTLNLKWQEALSRPDITAGLAYDQSGGAFKNQINITFGIPIPLWNRNKGNIKLAQAELTQSGLQREYKAQELRSQLQSRFQTWTYYQEQYLQFAQNSENIERVYTAVMQNFQNRNISILEFTDFVESYQQSMLQIQEMRKQLILSQENINQLVNRTIF
ncbi:TolC family protein [Dyadobacter tibetensis]|uniref:TolC family protein n=1 Tax=Dyadobacter tibetensis TaxID=1211851 RepID=UPI00046E79B5|nr:TolC family protein [Dyadobacter tibetensis]